METKMSNAIDDWQAAEYLGISVQTLRNWRSKRRGPAYLKLGRCVRYLRKDLAKYRCENRIDPKK